MNAKWLDGPEPIQLFLPMFTNHEIEAWTYAEQKLQQRREERKRRVDAVWISTNPKRALAIDALCSSLLDKPLGPVPDAELLDLGDPYIDGDDIEPAVDGELESDSWSDAAVNDLHEAVLDYSLRLLNARGNGKEKKDVLRWIFDPSAMAYAVGDSAEEKNWKFIKPTEVPFSFAMCCRLAGYDAERMMDGLMPVLKSMGLDALFKEIEYEHRNTGIETATVSNTVNLQHTRGAGKGRGYGRPTGPEGGSKSRPDVCL